MTFTTMLKEEISKEEINLINIRYELLAFLTIAGKINTEELLLTLENASIARRIYKELKIIYGVNPKITIRMQKRFKVKQIYILSVKNNLEVIQEDINKFKLEDLVSDEEKKDYLLGSFLASGNISNPSTSGYHLEFVLALESKALEILEVLNYFNLKAKMIKRGYKYITYIKASECISDLIKMFKATSSLFYFEDIRIYKDHKNMVNRLNNCEIANQEKSFKSGMEQVKNIEYLKEHDMFDLLDEKTKIVAEMRVKYPEYSMQEIADLISSENNYKIGKSGVNHHFIKIKNLVQKEMERCRDES